MGEAELGEGRGVGEALEDAVEVAGVAEVFEAEGRGAAAAALLLVVLLPRHVEDGGHQRRRIPAAAIPLSLLPPLLLRPPLRFDSSDSSPSSSERIVPAYSLISPRLLLPLLLCLCCLIDACLSRGGERARRSEWSRELTPKRSEGGERRKRKKLKGGE